jgi:hypothetical protein
MCFSRTLQEKILAKFNEICANEGIIHAQRTGESCWQKFKDVKSACRKMRGIHEQIKEKSGWTEANKKEAANNFGRRCTPSGLDRRRK